MSTTVQIGSPICIDWPDATSNRLHGKEGLVLRLGGRIYDERGEDRLFHVRVDGYPKVQIIAGRHLRLLRPDLERFIQSRRFALTGDDVLHRDYPEVDNVIANRTDALYPAADEYEGDISTCQNCGQYHDGIVYKACPSCGGYLG